MGSVPTPFLRMQRLGLMSPCIWAREGCARPANSREAIQCLLFPYLGPLTTLIRTNS